CALKHLHQPVQATRTQNDKRFAQTKIKDARVHYAVPKQQPPPPSPQHQRRSYLEQGKNKTAVLRTQQRTNNTNPKGPVFAFIDIPPMSKTTSTTLAH